VLVAVLSAPLLVFATTLYHDEATLYSAAQERAPEQAWTHGFLGLSLRRAGDCERAIPLLDRAAQLDPADPRYLTHLGHCLVETRRREAALAVALQGEARFAGTRQEAAFLLIHASSLPTPDANEMERLLRRCLAVYPGRTDCALGIETLRARRAAERAVPVPSERAE
jgi:predicted Zn-dependent protease